MEHGGSMDQDTPDDVDIFHIEDEPGFVKFKSAGGLGDPNDPEYRSCRTCAWACIHTLNECGKETSEGYLFPGGECPEAFTCPEWELGADFGIYMNSKDWGRAKKIIVR